MNVFLDQIATLRGEVRDLRTEVHAKPSVYAFNKKMKDQFDELKKQVTDEVMTEIDNKMAVADKDTKDYVHATMDARFEEQVAKKVSKKFNKWSDEIRTELMSDVVQSVNLEVQANANQINWTCLNAN